MPSDLSRPRTVVWLGLLPIIIIAIYAAIFDGVIHSSSSSSSSAKDPDDTHDETPDMAGPLRGFALNPRVFNASLYKSINDVWFGGMSAQAVGGLAPTKEMAMRWFAGGQEFDAQCQSAGAEALDAIGPSRLALPKFTTVQEDRVHYPEMARPFATQYGEAGKEQDPHARGQNALSLVLLLDQLSRNVYRKDQGLVYGHYDRLARAVSQDARARNVMDGPGFSDVQRYWLYMPLMHSEDLADHEAFDVYIRAKIAQAEEAGDAAAAGSLRNSLDFGERHMKIIRQFGSRSPSALVRVHAAAQLEPTEAALPQHDEQVDHRHSGTASVEGAAVIDNSDSTRRASDSSDCTCDNLSPLSLHSEERVDALHPERGDAGLPRVHDCAADAAAGDGGADVALVRAFVRVVIFCIFTRSINRTLRAGAKRESADAWRSIRTLNRLVNTGQKREITGG
ncbi:hypothetical protein PG993_003172 [Apiospora rasikravindrae]|uniref:Uncharacterized protein n=1 Tax=Apiospora rasikravindrae TaxID=990691 RepID=A0ABR1TZ72_9PEZI